MAVVIESHLVSVMLSLYAAVLGVNIADNFCPDYGDICHVITENICPQTHDEQ